MQTKEKPKKAAAKASGGKGNALQKALQPSEELAAVVGGPTPLSRSEAVSKVWDYIKANNLQNPENRREILADDTLAQGLRQGQGHHVRDEQAPRPAPEVKAGPKGSGRRHRRMRMSRAAATCRDAGPAVSDFSRLRFHRDDDRHPIHQIGRCGLPAETATWWPNPSGRRLGRQENLCR